MAEGTAVYLEIGAKRTFACAVDWPGWSRSGRSAEAALETLAAYCDRYARAAARAGMAVPRVVARDLDIVERVPGDATTDFGAPHAIPAVDRRPLDAAAARHDVALLDAAWEELAAVVAGAPAALRKGPRGGGRDRDQIVAHVVEAERSYARAIGVRLDAQEWRSGHVDLLRTRIREVLHRPSAAPRDERAWPPRYFTRRTAWHALDHAWEIEDRAD